MKKSLLFAGILGAVLGICGCNAPRYSCVPADITLRELEDRMLKAADPEGRAARAKSSLMRVQVKTERLLESALEEMVEIKFAQPDKFRMVTYRDNEPMTATVIDGNRGYFADCSSRRVVPLEKDALRLALLMAHLSNPTSRLDKVFDEVKVERCLSTVTQQNYFRLTCIKKGMDPVYIFVDPKTSLTKRIEAKFSIDGHSWEYASKNDRFEFSGGMMIPVETVSVTDGTKRTSKVLSYLLDVPIEPGDFLPPIF